MKSATNDLIYETSPYLLQHAHNPVDWKAWHKSVLEDAKKTHKLLLISVGYSACHWCHVMEHESFEDPEVADIMNAHYISIKVDREERPDIDQVYMQAVQLMTGSGGWPMNIVALPDGRPVWGGTYFRKEQWKSALLQIQQIYKKDPTQLTSYASKLEEGIQQLQLIDIDHNLQEFSQARLREFIAIWEPYLDMKLGGTKKAPKFMMPTNLDFLLRYAHQYKDNKLRDYVLHSLDKISFGGTFDHIGGGFARYSVDERWHVPHFEKMLYDNAQLLSLYSKAYRLTKDNWYKEVIEKTASFIETELTDSTGAFYSALDADSNNAKGIEEEGAFYTWKKEELKTLLGSEFDLFSAYFNINARGYWENGNYILYKTEKDRVFTEKHNISIEELQQKKSKWTTILTGARKKRKKPGLDDKTLTSWNALSLTGFTEAYRATANHHYLNIALKNAEFIIKNQLTSDYRLFHCYKNKQSKINAYLEDYAFTIEAFLKLYEVTFDKKWIDLSSHLTQYCFENFYNQEKTLFNFTSKKDDALISTPMELTDNVIPASNSAMANNLFRLGRITGNSRYLQVSEKMLQAVSGKIGSYPMGYSNWLDLYLNISNPFYELAILGQEVEKEQIDLQKKYLPNIMICGSTTKSELSILKDRFVKGKTSYYLCQQGTCGLAQEELSRVLKNIALV